MLWTLLAVQLCRWNDMFSDWLFAFCRASATYPLAVNSQPCAFVPSVRLVMLSSTCLSSHIWILEMHIPCTWASARTGDFVFSAVNQVSHHNMQSTTLGLAFICCWYCRIGMACKEVHLLVLLGLCGSSSLVWWNWFKHKWVLMLRNCFFFFHWALDCALVVQEVHRLSS